MAFVKTVLICMCERCGYGMQIIQRQWENHGWPRSGQNTARDVARPIGMYRCKAGHVSQGALNLVSIVSAPPWVSVECRQPLPLRALGYAANISAVAAHSEQHLASLGIPVSWTFADVGMEETRSGDG
jgi:hypothetical protein